MKLTTLLLIISLFKIQANTYSQSKKISLSIENSSVEKVIHEIESISEFRFLYESNLLDIERKVTLNFKKKKIANVLSLLFKGTNVDYKIYNRQVILTKRNYNSVFLASNSKIDTKEVSIQQHKITGNIKDNAGIPLLGASILEKGTNNGTQSDFNGDFSINVKAENATLIISYVGFVSQEVSLVGKTKVSVVLNENAASLDEVIVVGYGTQKKSDITGAVSQAKSEDFVDERPVLSVGQALQGVVPGLTISKSNGIPGEGYSFNIRGYNSINGGSPLILVDGSELDPNLVPPSDIESVTVLKDASSAAIYGARAAFGVVLITTKSGKKDSKNQFKYSSMISTTRPTTFPDKVDPITQVKIGGIQWENAGRTPGWYWGRNVQTWVDLYENPNYVSNSIPVINGVAYPLGNNNNMIDFMVEPGLTLSHNLSISGGPKKTTYYLSAGLMSQDGVLVLNKDKYNRKNVLTKVDAEINDWLSIGATMGYTKGVQNMPYIPNNASYMYSVSYLRPTFWLTGIDEVSGAPWGFSPAMVALGAENSYVTENTNVQLRTALSPFKGVTFKADYTHRSIIQNDSYHINTYEQANPTDGPGIVYKYRNDPNSLRKTATFDDYDNLFFTGEYEKEIANNHNVKLMIGYSQEESSYSSYYAQRQKLITDEVPALSLAVGNSSVGDGMTEWATRSGMYRLNYDYKGKYLLETLGRYDGSSRFEKENRFIFSPSVSAGWLMSKEAFMNGANHWIDIFKIRASYGTQGNQQVGAYSYLPSMGTGTANWMINGERPLYISPGGLVSDSYTWEKVNSANLGLDLAFFKNKLQTTLEFYKRETLGMLTAGQVLPNTLGTSVPNENAADLKVNGWEVSLKWSDRISSQFSYSANLIMYDDKAEITKYENPTGYLGSLYEGKEIGEIWGYETDRLFQESDFIDNGSRQYAYGIPTQNFIFGNRVPYPGDVKYKDLNNDNEIDRGEYTLEDHGDIKVIGNSRSRYQFGVKLGAKYSNLDVSIFLQGVAKKDYWTSGAFGFTSGSQYESILSHTVDYWTPDNIDAFYPRPDDRSYNKQTQTRYLLDASYLRFKTINMGYSLPNSVLDKIGIESIKVYFTGENLFLISSLPQGMDPELGASHTFPLAKDFSLGTTITF